MKTDLLSRIQTDAGDFMVLTRTRYLAFFPLPRSSVMPFKAAKFAASPGFQVQYNTADPAVLREWHQLLCAMLREGLFGPLSDGVRAGAFPYPEGKKELARYVKRFI